MSLERSLVRIGCKREVISYYENGSRDLKTEAIIKISQALNVSTDYLLGLSDNPTTDKDLRDVCEYTGLDINIIKVLHTWVEVEEVENLKVINEFLRGGGNDTK